MRLSPSRLGLGAIADDQLQLHRRSFLHCARQAAITAAGDYIRTQVDARGSVTIQFASQDFGGINPLAFAGSNYLVQPGSFFNGILFRKGTTNSSPFGPPEAFATWNSFGGTTWYTGSGLPVTSGQIDMQSVALHEISHTLGFASLIDPSNGTGLQGIQPDTYSRFDDLLRLGNTTGAPRLINPNGTFNSAQVTTSDLIGNNIYFHGEMAMAANGGDPGSAGRRRRSVAPAQFRDQRRHAPGHRDGDGAPDLPECRTRDAHRHRVEPVPVEELHRELGR